MPWLQIRPNIFPFSDPNPAQYVKGPYTSSPAKWHVNTSNGLSRKHECDRQTTDRQTSLRWNVWE